MKILLASFITLTAIFMAGIAAWDRGGTLADKILLICLSVVIVLAVHLLPAISKRPVMWLVWGVCLLCAVYGHLTFLTHASLRAGAAQSQETLKHIGIERQIQIIKESLEKIEARPVAVVAAELSKSTSKKERSALNLELAEAKKASVLRDQLIMLSGVSAEAQILESADPVVSKLAGFFGVKDTIIYVTIGLVISVLIEVIGALVWFEVLRVPVKNEAGSHVTQAVTNPMVINKNNGLCVSDGFEKILVTDNNSHVTPVTEHGSSHVNARDSGLLLSLKEAIDAGNCKPTVTSIQNFLNIARSRAAELRKLLKIRYAI
jgi:hypothetical protein